MDQQSDRALLPLTPGPWRHRSIGSTWRIYSLDAIDEEAMVIADLVHPSKANAVLIATAPRMLDLLLRWSREESSALDVQTEARRIISEIERASATRDD